jgi:hypothetical protein
LRPRSAPTKVERLDRLTVSGDEPATQTPTRREMADSPLLPTHLQESRVSLDGWRQG